ncbi:acyltransferase domain-containing protein [Streptomyces adelaidensis]|uniref:acyltransferase domain-containing protein n=1 Tax=Streptomyces adelaidensis TaxID=2796465 RepID=UPI0019088564|nr:acyltransferase domain-containing protein [Streptomyces adelaidensis]
MLLDALRADEELVEWLRRLEESEGAPGAEARLPDASDLPDILLDLAVPYEDVNDLVALRRTLADDEGATRLLGQCVDGLVRDLGKIGKGLKILPFPPESGPLGRYFPVFVFVAALPYVRAYHRERGIPDDVSRRALADLGRGLVLYRRRYGVGGLMAPTWFSLHFHGELFQLGRLQFQRTRLGGREGVAPAASGLALGPGEPCLDLHIPDYAGPLTPQACDRSLALARDFFPRHFPEERYTAACCHSWLLDPQLKRYLPADSNIVRFQERFRVGCGNGDPEDDLPVRFVFGDPDLPVETLPRRTSLERAVGDHLRAGGHWYSGHGWFAW